MSTDLQNKRTVVTGASSGIGRAIAIELASAGADVFVHARSNRDALLETVRAIEAAGKSAGYALGDLSNEDDRRRLVDGAFETGKVHCWINNAGVDVLTGSAAEWSYAEKLSRLWEVDVQATIFLSRLVLNRIEEGGSIINIGWDQAAIGMAGDSGEMFAATKGAIMAFSRSLAKTVAPRVRVNCVAPGWIKTDWGETASEYWQDRAQKESLSGRWGRPEDVAATIRFLLSDAGQFINGQVIDVNGGLA